MAFLPPTATFTAALLLLFLHTPLATSSPLNLTGDSLSPYEVLQGYNFPVGLLPQGVLKYKLDESTGRFHAYLEGSCSFSLEGSYQLKYKSTISGIISNNRLKNLSGISVKILFLWLNIVEVVRDEDELEFSVGIASASFPIDNFYECPQCGCGLDCANSNGKGTDHMIVKALPVIDDGLCSYKATLGFRIVDVEVQFSRCPRNHVQAICVLTLVIFLHFQPALSEDYR
ncbi:hypothetical protein PVK06_026704 [Gossypium arboreum]|uniref:Uncharacterized protein n=1 Tax=Gossypium arboreum TaxID=29729 RepID=A0ABR0NZN7_GOSAR|nr:hypothetical protein PVK06_026704 [Gossypium arboreum]